ncbi:MAG: GTPase HflX [Bacteroidales bacterium]|jgi:GTP-binding protein HflX|nr:GTPase HflX [Bacteroidales bacterium]
MIETYREPDRCVVVGVCTPNVTQQQAEEYLDELVFLIDTAGAVVEKRFLQNLKAIDQRTYVGSGKLNEILEYVTAAELEWIVFDDELSPAQLRNIERELKGVHVLDRTGLILNIFAQRARTAEAKTQVELAQYQYLLPRLTRMWSHLDRQRGGGGLTMRGAGETQLETDRRIVLSKIALLKEKLSIIDRQKSTQRSNRGELVRVALVGYTNVGKSTLMNLISKSDVFAENKLFATLDTTVRKVVIDNLPFLLSDTVGFIRKLPHGLVESFKSTLDEVRESDLLIHVVDISHPSFEQQIDVVNQTLREISADDKPTILLFNKIDAYRFEPKEEEDLTPIERKNFSLQQIETYCVEKYGAECFFMSAKECRNSANQTNDMTQLRVLLYNWIKDIHAIRYPNNNFLY